MSKQRGQSATILVVVICLILILAGAIFLLPAKNKKAILPQTTTTTTTTTDATNPVVNTNGAPTTSGQPVAPTQQATSSNDNGTGDFACSPDGNCRAYSKDVSKANCTKTFAASDCAGQCKNKSVQCKI